MMVKLAHQFIRSGLFNPGDKKSVNANNLG